MIIALIAAAAWTRRRRAAHARSALLKGTP